MATVSVGGNGAFVQSPVLNDGNEITVVPGPLPLSPDQGFVITVPVEDFGASGGTETGLDVGELSVGLFTDADHDSTDLDTSIDLAGTVIPVIGDAGSNPGDGADNPTELETGLTVGPGSVGEGVSTDADHDSTEFANTASVNGEEVPLAFDLYTNPGDGPEQATQGTLNLQLDTISGSVNVLTNADHDSTTLRVEGGLGDAQAPPVQVDATSEPSMTVVVGDDTILALPPESSSSAAPSFATGADTITLGSGADTVVEAGSATVAGIDGAALDALALPSDPAVDASPTLIGASHLGEASIASADAFAASDPLLSLGADSVAAADVADSFAAADAVPASVDSSDASIVSMDDGLTTIDISGIDDDLPKI